jgi:short-subunit dehydrogenase
MKKYTLITGSSSRIGFELAKNISQYSNVILNGSRDYNKIEKLRLQLSNPKNHLIYY